jgi:hypothetical protein
MCQEKRRKYYTIFQKKMLKAIGRVALTWTTIPTGIVVWLLAIMQTNHQKKITYFKPKSLFKKEALQEEKILF